MHRVRRDEPCPPWLEYADAAIGPRAAERWRMDFVLDEFDGGARRRGARRALLRASATGEGAGADGTAWRRTSRSATRASAARRRLRRRQRERERRHAGVVRREGEGGDRPADRRRRGAPSCPPRSRRRPRRSRRRRRWVRRGRDRQGRRRRRRRWGVRREGASKKEIKDRGLQERSEGMVEKAGAVALWGSRHGWRRARSVRTTRRTTSRGRGSAERSQYSAISALPQSPGRPERSPFTLDRRLPPDRGHAPRASATSLRDDVATPTLVSALVARVALVPATRSALSPAGAASDERTSIARLLHFRAAPPFLSELVDVAWLSSQCEPRPPSNDVACCRVRRRRWRRPQAFGSLRRRRRPPVLPDGEVVLETLEHGAKAMRVGVGARSSASRRARSAGSRAARWCASRAARTC